MAARDPKTGNQRRPSRSRSTPATKKARAIATDALPDTSTEPGAGPADVRASEPPVDEAHVEPEVPTVSAEPDAEPGPDPGTETTPVEQPTTEEPTSAELADEGAEVPVTGTEEIRLVGDLKPNAINARVFKQSLSEAGLGELANDIAVRGLRYPIDVTTDGVILDGERRWRAIRSLGWTHVKVVVRPGVESAEDIERYILQAYSTVRDATVEERVGVYRLAREVLARDHGRPAHRPPKKGGRSGDSSWPKEKVWGEAAKRAGFSSFKVADKAVAVFRKASKEIRTRVNSGELSISAAYDALSSREPKAKSRPAIEASTTTTTATVTSTTLEPPDEQVQVVDSGAHMTAAPEAGATSSDPVTDGAASAHTNAIAPGASEPEGCEQMPIVTAVRAAADSPVGAVQPVEHKDGDDTSANASSGENDVDNNIQAAWHLLMGAVRKPTTARRFIGAMAARAELDVWVESDDLADDLRDLGAHLRERLGGLAVENYGRASALLDSLIEELRNAVAAHRPDGESESPEALDE